MDKKRIRRLIALVGSSVLMWAMFVVAHELTHGTIYGYFGCENVSYGYITPVFYANCTDEGFVCSPACNIAQSNNEIVGYTVMPFLLIGITTVMIVARRLR